MVTGEDPRYIYRGGSTLAELEGELTDDLCTIISTRVRGQGALGGLEGEQLCGYQKLLLPLSSQRLLLLCQPEPMPKPCTVQCPRVSIPTPCHTVPYHAVPQRLSMGQGHPQLANGSSGAGSQAWRYSP